MPGDIVAGAAFSTAVGYDFFFDPDTSEGCEGAMPNRITDGIEHPPLTVTFDAPTGGSGFVTNRQMPAFDVRVTHEGGATETVSGGIASLQTTSTLAEGPAEFVNFAIDDVAFGALAAPSDAPLPAAGLLLPAGLAALAGAARARRKRRV